MAKKKISLADLFRSAIAALRALAERHAVEISVQIPDDATVHADVRRLGLAIQGVLYNSITAAPGGEITIRAEERAAAVEIVVEDSGGSVASDRLMEAFREPAAALGASIHDVIVSEHGGTASLYARPGAPTRWVFTLPTSTAAKSRPTEAEQAPAPAEASLPGRRILIADNDEDTANKVRDFLVKRGYEVELARNGKEALIKAKQVDPQMIILDVMMPDISGFDVIQVLKEDPATQHIPVMFLSILPDKEKGFRLGAVDYLVKPIREDSLVESVGAVLSKQRSGEVKKVLVVDDDRRITSLIARRLAAEGYYTREAYNGAEAIASIARDKPDLILLDMNMPVMGGMETLERIQANEDWARIPVIVVTATGYADKERCINLGAAKYLTKPFIEEDLLEEVANITDQVTGSAGTRRPA